MEMKQCNKCGGSGKIPGCIGVEMAARRNRYGLKQQDVAAKIGIPVAYLSRLEHNKNVWSREMMLQYVEALAILKNGKAKK